MTGVSHRYQENLNHQTNRLKAFREEYAQLFFGVCDSRTNTKDYVMGLMVDNLELKSRLKSVEEKLDKLLERFPQ